MNKKDNEPRISTIEQVADIVCDVLSPDTKKYEKEILGRTLTFRDQFVVYFTNKGVRPREEILSAYFLEKATLMIFSKNSFDYENFDFSVFNVFFRW